MVKGIKVLVLDIDGVVTNGTVEIAPGRKERKAIAFQDLDAVNAAVRAGLPVAFVTGEDNAMVDEIAQRFGVSQVIRGAKDKVAGLEKLSRRLQIPLRNFCYVGDGDRDAPAFAKVGLALAPSNARPAAKAAAHSVLLKTGGHGAVAEAVSLVLQLRDDAAIRENLQGTLRTLGGRHVANVRQMLDEQLPVLAAMAQILREALTTGRKIIFIAEHGWENLGRHFADSLVASIADFDTSSPIFFMPGVGGTFSAQKRGEVGFDKTMKRIIRPGDVVFAVGAPNTRSGLEGGLTIVKAEEARTVEFGFKGKSRLKAADVSFFSGERELSPVIHLLGWGLICETIERTLRRP